MMLSARSDRLRAVAATATAPIEVAEPTAKRSRSDGLRVLATTLRGDLVFCRRGNTLIALESDPKHHLTAATGGGLASRAPYAPTIRRRFILRI